MIYFTIFRIAKHWKHSLPPDLRQPGLSYGQFRRSLKTFLFGQWDHGTVWTVLTAPSRNILTYLLAYSLTYLLHVTHLCYRSVVRDHQALGLILSSLKHFLWAATRAVYRSPPHSTLPWHPNIREFADYVPEPESAVRCLGGKLLKIAWSSLVLEAGWCSATMAKHWRQTETGKMVRNLLNA